MNTMPRDKNNLVTQQASDRLGVVTLHSTTLSWGERLLPYLFAAMETCWVDAILIWIAGINVSSAHTFLLPLWVPYVLIASSYWLSNALPGGRVIATSGSPQSPTSFLIQSLVVCLIFGTILFSLWSGVYSSSIAFLNPIWLGSLIGDLFLLGPESLHIGIILVLALYFCWRGLRLLHSTLEPGSVLIVLRLGVGVMLAVIVFRAAASATAHQVLLLLLIPLFLAFVLIAHAFAQTVFVRTMHRSGLQGSVLVQERALLGIIVAFGIVLLLFSLLVGAVASPAFLADAQRIFEPVARVYNVIANVIAFVVALIAAPFIWLLQLFHFKLQEPNPQVSTPLELCKKYPQSVQCLSPPHNSSGSLLVLAIKILLPILVVFLLVLIVRLLRRKRSVRLTRRIEDVHESLWSWELFVTQLRAFFHALWLRLFPQQREETQGQHSENDGASEPTARSMREMYRAMLRWAALRGYPRKRDETPYEFRVRLHAHLPLTEPELSTVTEAYTAIRYGNVVPSEADVARIQQTWTQLQQKSQNMQREL